MPQAASRCTHLAFSHHEHGLWMGMLDALGFTASQTRLIGSDPIGIRPCKDTVDTKLNPMLNPPTPKAGPSQTTLCLWTDPLLSHVRC